MSDVKGLGISRPAPLARGLENAEQIIPQHALRRILAFRLRSIDDVVNDPIVKREIFGYFKLQLQIARVCETVELEQQWNSAE